ncbi:MAG: amino acid permease [Clostridium sp.]|uniref:amino acid permease n=1 Tax=Clostridium sp. TaxID=1506 RepID=UPI003F3A31DB
MLYIVVPSINTGFFMILILTTILYCIVYLFIIIARIVLRYKKPEVKRAFTIPGKHNLGMWIIAGIAYIGVILTIVVSFIPSDDIPQKDHLGYVIFLLIGTIFWVIIPLIIYKFKKPSWVKISSLIVVKRY